MAPLGGTCNYCVNEPEKVTCNSVWCTDLSYDRANCGACGHSCSDYKTPSGLNAEISKPCDNGVCQLSLQTKYPVSSCREICAAAGMHCGSKVWDEAHCGTLGPSAGMTHYKTHSGTSVYQCATLGCDTVPDTWGVDELQNCLCEAGP